MNQSWPIGSFPSTRGTSLSKDLGKTEPLTPSDETEKKKWMHCNMLIGIGMEKVLRLHSLSGLVFFTLLVGVAAVVIVMFHFPFLKV